MSTAPTIVSTGCFSVAWMIGRYAALQPGRGVELVARLIDPSRVLLRLHVAEEPVREHRDDRECDEERRGQRDRDGDGERPEQLARDVSHQRQRQEHRDRREGGCGDRAGDFAHRRLDRIQLGLAKPDMPLDVLDHDDRVVDDSPDRDRECAERDDVERVAEDPHPDEGDEAPRPGSRSR